MNLYLRLLLLLIRHYFKPQHADIVSETHLELTVLPNDLDLMRHMNNGRYLTVMDLGRLDFIAKTGLLKIMLRRKWLPVVGAAQMIYLRPLHLMQHYAIHTSIQSWDDKWFIVKQRFVANSKTIAVGYVRAQFRFKRTNIPPQKILAELGYGEMTSPNLDPTLQQWLIALKANKED